MREHVPAAGMATTDARYPKWYGCGIVDADKALIDTPPPPPTGGLDAVDDAATIAEDGRSMSRSSPTTATRTATA